MKRIISSLIIIILFTVVLLSHLYGSYSATHSDAFIKAKAIAAHDEMYEVSIGNVFISEPIQYVFLLTDNEQNAYWSFVIDDEIYRTVDANDGLDINDISQILRALRIPNFNEVHQMTPGLVLAQYSNEHPPYYSQLTNSDILWEIIGINEYNKVQYTYLDYYTGQLIWNYQLK